jgi:hypothetical protein
MATIVVQHRIKDAEKFFGLTSEVTDAPDGIRTLQFCPSQDKTAAVCLWEAGSLEALQDYLEAIPGSDEITENSYYVVDDELAFGLPEQTAAGA